MSLTPLVRALCVTSGAQLEQEIRLGPPASLLPPVPGRRAPPPDTKPVKEHREVRLGVMQQLSARRRLVAAAAVALEPA
jgi:hypothetical protein